MGSETTPYDRMRQPPRADLAEQLRREWLEDLRWLVSGPRGRRIAWRLLEMTGWFRSSFDADPYVTAFREGSRSNGLALLNDLQHVSPDFYATAAKEQREHDHRIAGNTGTGR